MTQSKNSRELFIPNPRISGRTIEGIFNSERAIPKDMKGEGCDLASSP